MDGRRKLIGGGQSIGDRGGHKSAFGELQAELVVTVAVTRAKAATVNAEHGGKRTGAFARPGEVQRQMLLIRIRVLNRLFEDDRLRHHDVGPPDE